MFYQFIFVSFKKQNYRLYYWKVPNDETSINPTKVNNSHRTKCPFCLQTQHVISACVTARICGAKVGFVRHDFQQNQY